MRGPQTWAIAFALTASLSAEAGVPQSKASQPPEPIPNPLYLRVGEKRIFHGGYIAFRPDGLKNNGAVSMDFQVTNLVVKGIKPGSSRFTVNSVVLENGRRKIQTKVITVEVGR